MKWFIRKAGILAAGIALIALAGCSTCGTPYRRELSNNPGLAEANRSYKKAISWLDKAECSSSSPEAERSYRTAEGYISDTIFKLNERADNNVDVSEDIYYCERMKIETDVKIGAADRQK